MGRSHCSGRVELLHKETRHTVCEAAFDWQDAEVVCRELDCGAPVEVLGAAAFGEGKGQVWSEEIQCGGNETQIQLCPTSALNHSCSHENDVGLSCRGTNKICYYWIHNIHDMFKHCPNTLSSLLSLPRCSEAGEW